MLNTTFFTLPFFFPQRILHYYIINQSLPDIAIKFLTKILPCNLKLSLHKYICNIIQSSWWKIQLYSHIDYYNDI
jgi:hypothetical protein